MNDNAPDNDRPLDPVRPCTICGKPATLRFRPFCSKRCADVDLNRWLSGAYAIPVTEDDDEDGGSGKSGGPER
ncbi:DNA gyrase inhibitor YacG [Phreatobacter sp.]|uniref:DNA gyrase inhibitor YacG n=1 Tax=Phreatobacter sp. TaxID=1966341 RepID=UPI003F6F430A